MLFKHFRLLSELTSVSADSVELKPIAPVTSSAACLSGRSSAPPNPNTPQPKSITQDANPSILSSTPHPKHKVLSSPPPPHRHHHKTTSKGKKANRTTKPKGDPSCLAWWDFDSQLRRYAEWSLSGPRHCYHHPVPLRILLKKPFFVRAWPLSAQDFGRRVPDFWCLGLRAFRLRE